MKIEIGQKYRIIDYPEPKYIGLIVKVIDIDNIFIKCVKEDGEWFLLYRSELGPLRKEKLKRLLK